MIKDDKVIVPFSDEEVLNLNRWQDCDNTHAFTCGVCRDRQVDECVAAKLPLDEWPRDQFELTATNDGWICKTCDYTQDWAHDFMLKKPMSLKDIFESAKKS